MRALLRTDRIGTWVGGVILLPVCPWGNRFFNGGSRGSLRGALRLDEQPGELFRVGDQPDVGGRAAGTVNRKHVEAPGGGEEQHRCAVGSSHVHPPAGILAFDPDQETGDLLCPVNGIARRAHHPAAVRAKHHVLRQQCGQRVGIGTLDGGHDARQQRQLVLRFARWSRGVAQFLRGPAEQLAHRRGVVSSTSATCMEVKPKAWCST